MMAVNQLNVLEFESGLQLNSAVNINEALFIVLG